MKRIDMWITDKQDEAIADLVNNNESLNKSRIIRDALDEYLKTHKNKDKQDE